MAASSTLPLPKEITHLTTCRYHSASSVDMPRCSKIGCYCASQVQTSSSYLIQDGSFAPCTNEKSFKLDLGSDFDSGFSLDFSEFHLASSASSSASSSPRSRPSPLPPVIAVTPPTAAVPLPSEPVTPVLSRSASLPSISSSPVTPTTPAYPDIVARARTPPLKGVLVSPRDGPSPSPSPPAGVKFALPPPGAQLRLPQLQGSAAARDSRPQRRMQVGAFGELSWVTEPEPIRHTQPEARNQILNQDTSDYASSGGSLLGRRRGAPPGLSAPQRSHTWNGGHARRQMHDQDDNRNWLIAYHVQQLTHERERQRQKHMLILKEQKERERVLAPSPLSRDASGRGPSRLPSITEEASRPPRSTSLSVSTPRASRPVRSTSLHALATSPTTPTMRLVPSSEREHANEDLFAKAPTTRSPIVSRNSTGFSPTSPLAQAPITRAPSPPSPAVARRVITPEPTPSRLPRRGSLLNLKLKLDLRFGKKSNKSFHSRSNSQSSRVSEASESNSEGSEDSFGSADTVEEIHTPVSPASPVSYTASHSFSSFKSFTSDLEADANNRSCASFATCQSAMSVETLTPRTGSPAFSSDGPETPGARTPRAVPGTPDSDVLTTPQTAMYTRSWPQNVKVDTVAADRSSVSAF